MATSFVFVKDFDKINDGIRKTQRIVMQGNLFNANFQKSNKYKSLWPTDKKKNFRWIMMWQTHLVKMLASPLLPIN